MGPEVVMVPVAVAAAAIALARIASRLRMPTKDAEIVLRVTAHLAVHRGDAVITVEHIALALAEDASVRAILAAKIDVEALRRALTVHLDELPRLEKGVVPTFDAHVRRVIVDATSRRLLRGMRPCDLLWGVLLRETGFARDWLDKNGLTFEALREVEKRTSTAGVTGHGVADAPSSAHPYRVGDARGDDVRVVFVNDAKTQVPFVIDVLMTELGKDPGAACYLTVEVDQRGEAVVATMPRVEAESVVYRITARARNAGFPLVVELRPTASLTPSPESSTGTLTRTRHPT